MLTSKQRADLRAQANDLDTTLMVGQGRRDGERSVRGRPAA